MEKNKVIILAGGSGERFGLTKQFIPINGIPVFIHTLRKFVELNTVLVIPTQYFSLVKNTLDFYKLNAHLVCGGDTRQSSVNNALSYIDSLGGCENVIITDANRPCITKDTINKCIEYLDAVNAVVTVCRNVNTCCISEDEHTVKTVLDRSNMYELLMPQCFKFKLLYKAHCLTELKNCTDDIQILRSIKPESFIELLNIPYWEGLKLTRIEDYPIFEKLLEKEIN